MAFSRGIRHLLLGSLACLLLIGLSATYWAVAGRDSLLLRADNPRLIEALAAIQRGSIFDRNQQLLAESIVQDGALTRRYLRPATYSATGYYSLRYGVSGAESAFDALLSGSSEIQTLQDYVNRGLLNRPQVGSDIRLAIDARLQTALVNAIGDARAAAVVLEAQSGRVLALISQPTYDPNTLEDDWEYLIEADGQPFFNRALQGRYQLGGAMYTVLLAHAAASDFDLSQRFPQASAPIEFQDGMTLACVIKPKQNELSLADAYAHGCPAPFQSYYLANNAIDMERSLAPYAFDNPITLDGFPRPERSEPPAVPSEGQLDADTLALRSALGQGDLTTTPLHLAAIMAAIATDGGAPAPQILSATRPPNEDQWQKTTGDSTVVSIMSADVAQELRLILRRAWHKLLGEFESVPGAVGAQVALSQSGESKQIWLNGFYQSPGKSPISFVILLEDRDDPQAMLTIGKAMIRAIDDLH
ncbi:MAG: penicillin-binding transpeptidase domain-containing protein [Chloroflexi bacterium]|nr:penicillin-binding transpeptidase domain-containing protein [Chloroflexota bacterium]